MIRDILDRMGLMFIGNVISRGLSFLFFYFLAKSLGVENYGMLTVILLLISSVVDLTSSGLNATIIRAAAKNNVDNKYLGSLMFTSIVNVVLFFLFLMPLVVFNVDYIGDLIFESGRYNDLILISIIPTLFSVLYGQICSLFIGLESYKDYAKLVIVHPGIRLSLTGLLYATVGVSVKLIVLAITISSIMTVVYGYVLMVRRIGYRSRYSGEIVKNNFSFGGWMLIWAVIMVIQSKIDLYLINEKLDFKSVANYDIVLKMIAVVMILFNSYGASLSPIFAKIKERKNLLTEINNTIPHLILFSVIIIIGSFVSPYFLDFAYGYEYKDAGTIIPIMMMSLIFYLFTLPFNAVIYSLGKAKYFCAISILELMAKIIFTTNLINYFELVGAAISYMSINVLSLLCSYLFYKLSFKGGMLKK